MAGTTSKVKSTFSIFKNQFVRIMLKNVSYETASKRIPLSMEGYLLAENKNEYFFGDTPNEVSFSVPKESVIMTELMKKVPKDKYEEMLDELEVPKDTKGMN